MHWVPLLQLWRSAFWMHNMTSWIGKVIDWLFFGVGGHATTDCQGYKVLQMVSSFFLTNTSGAVVRRHARWLVDQLVTHLSLNVLEHSAPCCCSWEPWTETNGHWKSFIITKMPKRAVFSLITGPLHISSLAPHFLTRTLPGWRRLGLFDSVFPSEPAVRAAWLAASLPNTSAPGVKSPLNTFNSALMQPQSYFGHHL